MSPIMRPAVLPVVLLAVLSALLFGCGTANDQAVYDGDTGQHAAGWLPAGHAVAAQADETRCFECHGADLSGGVSAVSCSQCHLGGPNSAHPEDWGDQAPIKHAPYVAANGNAACSNQYCHGTDLSGVADSGPSCTACHLGGTDSVHPQDWGSYAYVKHALYVSSSGTAGCANASCHGTDLGGVTGSGPSCTSCHLGGIYSVHPASWDADITLHKQYVASNGGSACANAVCHGSQLQGVAGSGPSCYTCH